MTARVLLGDRDAAFVAALVEAGGRHAGFAFDPTPPSRLATALVAAEHDAAVLDASLIADGGLAQAAAAFAAARPVLLTVPPGAEESPGPAWACELLDKPLRLGLLIDRLTARLAQAQSPIRLGPAEFRPAERSLIGAAGPIALTEKEAALLARLAAADGEPVGRQTLLEEVWGYNPEVASHTLETHIYRLRQKLESAGAKAELATVAGGYRLEKP